MAKIYSERSVFDAAMERIAFIFEQFDNIYVSFSGGKDSGVLLHLCLHYMKTKGITKKIGVFHQDFEAQYTATTEYVTDVLTSKENLELIKPYWLCMPMKSKTATSMFEQYWTPWEHEKRDIWVREMPNYQGVINMENHQLDFWRPGIMQEDVYREFSPWYQRHMGGGKTICLVGIRADESLNRFRAINRVKDRFMGQPWTTNIAPDVWSGYPIYDWTVDDIWTANAKFGFPYNRLYDLFHMAGLSIHEMRVASPFNDWAIGSLKLYRVIEPSIWARMVSRVNGVNFCGIYGGTTAMGWKSITKPPGHTWQSYMEFLLSTLPKDTADTYRRKLAASKKSWVIGGAMDVETIEQLEQEGAPIIRTGEASNRSKNGKEIVQFNDYLDDTTVDDFKRIPTYKRMCICIMKNDHLCKYMGFTQTKAEMDRRKNVIAKYESL